MATPRKKPSRRNSSIETEAFDPVDAYANDVCDGRTIAGPHVRNACRRHLLDRQYGPKRGLRWDLPAALDVFEFFEKALRLSQSFAGEPFALQPSQQFIVGSIFGWKRAGGVRRFRRAYIEIGKGNGKSPLAAGIGMYMLLADGERQAEVYAAASVKEQAMVIFRSAVEMWRQSPALMERLTPSGGNPIWNLADLKTGSFFRPISSEQSFSGPMPSCALCDEVHEHRNADAIEMLERGFKSRRQPLLLMITNSGFDPKSVCGQEHLHAIRVAAGHMEADKDPAFVGDVIDDRAFSYVCGLDAEDDPLEDSTCWVKANPLIGISQPWDELQTAVGQAKQIPGRLNGILRLHFCVWTDAEEAWMGRAALEAVLADFDPEEHFGSEVYCGIDLSATRDFTALAFVVPTGTVERIRKEKDGREIPVMLPTYDAWVEAWTPAETLAERALHDQQAYDVWARDGHLTATPGKVVRMDFVAARVAEAAHQYEIADLAYDAWGFKRVFESELDALGVTVRLVEHPQGGKRQAAPSEEQKDVAKLNGKAPPPGLAMPKSLRAIEELILDERIRILRNPVLISAVMSATIESDAFNNRWFSKRKAVNRIDALVALAMAVGAAEAGGDGGSSVYEERGLLVI